MRTLLCLVFAVGCALTTSAQAKGETAELKIHPKVFSMITGWLSDSKSPVVTEINLDAAKIGGNQFSDAKLATEDGWTRCPDSEGQGFLRYKVLSSKGNHYKVEYQENGGGSLTSAYIIEFMIEKREIRREGKTVNIRVLRVIACDLK